jgi:hypothetical protein
MDNPAWSYTSLSAFETCPKRYYLTRIAKEIIEPQTKEMTWGNAVHKAMEHAVVEKKPLPETMKQWQGVADKINAAPGKKHAEQKMAINKYFAPVTWYAKDAWCRGIVDSVVEVDDHAKVFDYKTGKRKLDGSQLKLFSLLTFHTRPWINKVTTAFIWLKDSKIDKDSFVRDDVGMLWQEFLPRLERMQSAYKTGKFPPKPSGLCRNYCPCTGCEYHGK